MPLPYLCNIKSNEMYNLKNKTITLDLHPRITDKIEKINL